MMSSGRPVSATARLAHADQLEAAIAEALRLIDGGPYAVICPLCGSKVGKVCYGNGPMHEPHGMRQQMARNAARDTLRAAIGIPADPTDGKA